MINKNDLRYIKTERNIEETYLALKMKSKKLIKVNDLCKAALINKTTFYSHYETMESLHSHICKKTISQILANCPHIEDAFNDTASFVLSLMSLLGESSTVIEKLFGNDENLIINEVEEFLLNLYLHKYESQDIEMQIIFAIGGASRLIVRSKDANRAQMTISILQKLF